MHAALARRLWAPPTRCCDGPLPAAELGVLPSLPAAAEGETEAAAEEEDDLADEESEEEEDPFPAALGALPAEGETEAAEDDDDLADEDN